MNTLKRQGDVLLERVADSLDQTDYVAVGQALQPRDGIIAEGEMTGHAHRLVGGKLTAMRGVGLVAVVETPAEVVHDEHDTLELEPGIWLVHRQTEYVGKDERVQVYD